MIITANYTSTCKCNFLTLCLPVYFRASWRSLPVSSVTKSLSSDTHWSPTWGHTPRRNHSSVLTVTTHRPSKVDQCQCPYWFIIKEGYKSIFFFIYIYIFSFKPTWMFTWGSTQERSSAVSTVLSTAWAQDTSRCCTNSITDIDNISSKVLYPEYNYY